MAKFTQLRDFCSFPDFTPNTHIHGISGDPYAAVITLRRLRKKHAADIAAPATTPTTIKTLVFRPSVVRPQVAILTVIPVNPSAGER